MSMAVSGEARTSLEEAGDDSRDGSAFVELPGGETAETVEGGWSKELAACPEPVL